MDATEWAQLKKRRRERRERGSENPREIPRKRRGDLARGISGGGAWPRRGNREREEENLRVKGITGIAIRGGGGEKES